MNNLQIINHNNQRVLTTAQLAESYGAEADYINRNFNNNKDRYKVGKHFFMLEGDELKEFKVTIGKNDGSLLRVNKLYLWTEKGAWLHAKSLNTDQAWEAYEMLVDDYYNVKALVDPYANLSTELKAIFVMDNKVQKLESRIEEVDTKLETQITLHHGEQRRLQKAVATRVYELEEDKEYRPSLFSALYREIKDRWGVSSYCDVKRKDLPAVLRYIEAWVPKVS